MRPGAPRRGRWRLTGAAAFAAATLVLGAPAARAQDPLYRALWNSPAAEQRIAEGIQANRTGWVTLSFVDSAGRPVTNVEARVEQTSHDFLFGANLFMLGGFPTAAQNRAYEAAFTGLFNYASAPFYLKTLEPEQGRPRFAANSAPVSRRPPPDAVLAFARRHGLTVKGHPLIWGHDRWFIPDWWPDNPTDAAGAMQRHFEQVAARYRESVPVWDVVNEALRRQPRDVVLPRDYVFNAFRLADRLFPASTALMINEVTGVWFDFHHQESPYYLLVQNLLLRGARVDAIGIQCHFFSEQLYADVLAGKAMTPDDVRRVLDLYAGLGRPVHVTEITVPTLPNTPAGAEAQATVVRNLYRLWFSHPAVEAITWWNLADGTAAPGEDKWNAGLLRADLTPKPSYRALEQLIRRDWTTRTRVATGAASEATFRGFYGAYTVDVTAGGRTVRRQIHPRKGMPNRFTLVLDRPTSR